MKKYADEAVCIIKDVIGNNELLKGSLISFVGCNECGDTITIRDLLNCETKYSLSEVSYIFMDYLDCLGDFDKSAYKTVLASKDDLEHKDAKKLFMEALSRLKEIEKSV